jgi:MFS family permease
VDCLIQWTQCGCSVEQEWYVLRKWAGSGEGYRRDTFSALRVPNYRKFFIGQSISLIGTWMQMTAQAWLVLVLTGSATKLGLIVALQTLPVLLLGPYAGLIADRVDKRRLLMVLQAVMAVLAAVLAGLTLAGAVTFAEVAVLATVLGLVNCFSNPTQQSFVLEMVGADQLHNAISLNSTMVNAARAVGPAVGGVLIATVGTGWCFVLNALSFIAVVLALVWMNKDELLRSVPVVRAKRQLRAGFKAVKADVRLWAPLAMMALVGTFAYEFQVTLPVLAKHTFAGGSISFGAMTAAMGTGAVIGGLYTATVGKVGLGRLSVAAGLFGVTMAMTALAPGTVWACAGLVVVGFVSVMFLATGNASLQLAVAPQMRGRVMALWAVAFLGSTPIGGPLIGWVCERSGARVGLLVGAVACLMAACLGWAVRRAGASQVEMRED